MKRALIMPVLAALLSAAACGGGEVTTPGVPPTTGPPASVRFFNATTGMTGRGGFTTNGQFVAGSALAFGQSTQTCSAVNPGSTSFGFGAANTGGTGLSGNALATLNAQSVIESGNFTVVATGSATSPKLFMLDNNFSGSLGTNQAAVRFVNLAPGSGTTANTFNAYLGTFGGIHAQLIATNIAVGSSTTFTTVPSGPHVFSILQGQTVVILGSTATLEAGTINTIAIVPNTPGGFQLISIPRCS